ncbi:MAG: 2-amino-4-hydroxy-6-hydroxymethyldihydropteridine diphosphokinase [Gammaproteobacteria bacterium]
MTRVFVAAGSNVDAKRNLRLASSELARAFGKVDFSPAYRNVAAGFEGDDFINFVAAFDTDLPVRDVVAELQRIEGLCGRERNAPKWAPRSMDLDILLFGNMICDEPGLVLPRPDLLRRAYMLGPMADVGGGIIHPLEQRTISQLWENFDRGAHPLTRIELSLGDQ